MNKRERTNDRKCYKCQGTGHIAKDCTSQ
jgi:hypothetical protein